MRCNVSIEYAVIRHLSTPRFSRICAILLAGLWNEILDGEHVHPIRCLRVFLAFAPSKWKDKFAFFWCVLDIFTTFRLDTVVFWILSFHLESDSLFQIWIVRFQAPHFIRAYVPFFWHIKKIENTCIPSCAVVPLTLTFPELQQQRGHLAVTWNLGTNAVIDFFYFWCCVELTQLCQLLNFDIAVEVSRDVWQSVTVEKTV